MKNLKLLQGGLPKKTTAINTIQIAVAPKESPPFPVEVMVFEEDTNLILTVDPVIEHKEEHIIRTMTDIMTAETHKPGSVVVNGNSWYAVVIDLDSDPICRKEWCEKAIKQVFQLAEKNRVSSLALPILGTVYGNLQIEYNLQYLLGIVSTMTPCALKRLWIAAPQKDVGQIRKIVDSQPDSIKPAADQS